VSLAAYADSAAEQALERALAPHEWACGRCWNEVLERHVLGKAYRLDLARAASANSSLVAYSVGAFRLRQRKPLAGHGAPTGPLPVRVRRSRQWSPPRYAPE
jgi:hypothetical protein